MNQNDSPIGLDLHNHEKCRAMALDRARRTCVDNGVQFTATRQQVLEILLERHRALGAYDVLDRLNADGAGAKPPIAYRALSFLVEHGLAHRIEKLNAFVACAHPGAEHNPAFMICRCCKAVGETALGNGPAARAGAVGFEIEQTVAEVIGICAHCQQAGRTKGAKK